MNVSSWNGATGNWRNAADWSNGVPDAATEADFTASGAYTVTLSRSDAFTVGAVDFNAAGATLALQGSLTVNGVFDLKAGTLVMSKAGVIHGGTLMMDGGTLVSQGGLGSQGGRLDGVHLAGRLNLATPVETLKITNGLTGVSGAQIWLSGGEDSLTFIGAQTIDNVTIVLDDSASFSVVYTKDTLTFGANATLTTTAFGPEGVLAGSGVVNNGTITSAPSGALGTFNIGLNHSFINNGLVTAASNLDITASKVVNSASGAVNVGQFINVLIQGSFYNRGSLTIAPSGSVDIASNTTIVNAGTISVGAGSLSLDQSTGPGVVSFTNTGAITIGQQGSLALLFNFTIASLRNIVDAGRLYLGGTLDNPGGTLHLDAGPIFGGAGTTLGYGGLFSGGTVVLGGAHLAYTGGGLANVTFEGGLDLGAANASVNLDGGVVVTSANGTGPGVINLTGAGASLTFFDMTGTTANGIDNVRIKAGNSRSAVVIAPQNFDGAAETLTLGAHASIVSTAAGAQVIVQNGAAAGSIIVNAGRIEAAASGGSFSVTIPTLENDGQVIVSNGDTFALSGALTGSGQLVVETGATAQIGAAAANQSVVFADAAGTLKLSSAAKFAATLSGAVIGDKIDLLGTPATAATVNANDQLVITDNGAKVATIQLAGDYANTTFNVARDGAGGSLITLANAPAIHGIVRAMASLVGAGGPGALAGAHAEPTRSMTLARPAVP
ncbi:MAG: hypothetical protein ABI306_09230 [Caulobacteraceae bacterium]